MAWEVEYTDEFGAWWDGLSEAKQDSVAMAVRALQQARANAALSP